MASNEISGKFLLKLFDKTGHKKGINFFDRYQIGKELDFNTIQIDDIVDVFALDGFVAKDEEIEDSSKMTKEREIRNFTILLAIIKYSAV